MLTRTDAELLETYARSDDSAAFAEIVSRYGAMVYRVCFRTLANQHEAEDASQAVFLALAEKASKLRREEPLASWLHTVSRQTALFLARTRARRKRREATAAELLELERSQEEVEPGRGTLFRALDEALDSLSEVQREAVILRHLRGLSEKEAAAAAGCAANTLSCRASDGVARLRRILAERGCTLGAPALLAALETEAGASVPQTLIPSILAASRLAAGTVGATAGAGYVLGIMEGAMRAIFMTKAKLVGVGLVVGLAAGLVGMRIVDEVRVGMAGTAIARKASLLDGESDKLSMKSYGEVKRYADDRRKATAAKRSSKNKAKPLNRSLTAESFNSNIDRAISEINAAEVYKMIFAIMQSEATRGKISRIKELTGLGGDPNKTAQKLTEEEKEELKRLLHSPEIREIADLLKEATQKDSCDFNLDYSQGYSLPLPHLSQIRELVRLANGMAMAAATGGDTSGAIELLELGLKASASVSADSLLISQLVTFACDKIMISAIDTIADAPVSEAQLNSLMLELAKRDYAADMADALNQEASFFNDAMDKLAAGDLSIEELLGGTDNKVADKSDLLRILGDKELVEANKRKVGEYYGRLASLLSSPYDDSAKAQAEKMSSDFKALPIDEYAMVLLFAPSMDALLKKTAECSSGLDAAFQKLAISIYKSKYGKEPESAADLKEILDSVAGLSEKTR